MNNLFLEPTDRADYERSVSVARERLDEPVFAAAWADGRAMTLEQAIAYALEVSPVDVEQPARAAAALISSR
jgi:hypothetical protein